MANPASFRLNGAALRATPGSTLAGLAKNSSCKMGHTIGIQVGQIKCVNWAKPDARTHLERLGNIVHCAGAKSSQLILGFVQCAQEYDRNACNVFSGGLELFAHFIAAHLWHVDV